jgi:hypothetical protein
MCVMRVDYDSVRYSLTISFLSKCNIIVVPVHLQAYHVLFDYSKLKHVKVIYKTILPGPFLVHDLSPGL